ncbi:MAG: glutamyl-tRNA reductase [Bacteroidetes bacterium GWA2_31_9]|nr:MAG: glutamyl-tRNA reductase [Bacteroidetes bacterium GWA2_31_9]
MHTIVVGLNYKTTQVDNREKVYFSSDKLESALKSLITYPSVKECVILSTCNRVEIYAIAEDVETAFESVTNFISDFHNISVSTFKPFLYRFNCEEAVTHVFRVASSLDSMLVGEYEILGQVKCAYEAAQEHGTTKEYLNRLFQMAIQVGKRVRTETAIGKGSISVGSVATSLVKDVFPEERTINIMLIGAGAVADLTATNLKQKLDCNITITNRSKQKAEEFAQKFNAKVVDYEDRKCLYYHQDVIIASTGAQDHVVQKADFVSIGDTMKKMFFVDLSVPRNIDPSITELENPFFVFTIDDLESMVISNMDERATEIKSAESIIADTELKYFEWYGKQAIVPVMRDIKRDFESMQSGIFDCYKKDLGTLSDEQQIVVKKMMEVYGDKIIKTIMLNLKEVTDAKDLHHVGDVLKRTFSINISEKMMANGQPHGMPMGHPHGMPKGHPPVHPHGMPDGHPHSHSNGHLHNNGNCSEQHNHTHHNRNATDPHKN